MAVFVDDLKKAVIDNAKASDKIVIISGYLSPDMVDEVATLGIPFEFYYGSSTLLHLSNHPKNPYLLHFAVLYTLGHMSEYRLYTYTADNSLPLIL